MFVYAGAGKATMTPPTGTLLSGYMAKERTSIGVHDPVYPRVITVKNGDDCFESFITLLEKGASETFRDTIIKNVSDMIE